MRLGFAVKVIGRSDLPSHDTRRWQSDPDLGTSIRYLHEIFDYLDVIDVRMYRMASSVAPYASHPEMPKFRDQPQRFSHELRALGDKSKELKIRLSTHPGQYTVLNSTNEAIVRAAVEELEVHAEIMDAMGLGAEAVIVLHVGGAAGGRDEARDRWARGFERLSESAQSRLAVENDDRSFAIDDVVAVSKLTGCRVVWDVLHHHCFNPARIPDRDALELAVATWPNGMTPKIHYSSPRTTLDAGLTAKRKRAPRPPQLRAHADMVDPIAFGWFLDHVVRSIDVDVMLEAKAKDVALLELRRHLNRHQGVPGALSGYESPLG